MLRLCATIALLFAFCSAAHADVWKWVDAKGKTHFVDTMKPIYTWIDEFGKVHYADKPEHQDAVSVELVWHSSGTLEDLENEGEAGDGYAHPGETAEDRAEREQAEAYYCKRATEVYDSYVSAPQLYRTNEAGEKEYLSKAEGDAIIAETKARVDELCN